MNKLAPEQCARRAKLQSLLSQITILRGCSAAQLDQLGQTATIQRHERGATIVEQSLTPTSVLLLAYGRARLVFYGEDGRELILSDLEAGACLGDEALTRAATSRATVVALAESTVVAIPADDFAAFAAANARVALQLAAQLSRQLTATAEAFAGLGLFGVEERLVRTLAVLARQQPLASRPTHSELAARIGACRETVTRAFQSLARRGLLRDQGDGLFLPPSHKQPI